LLTSKGRNFGNLYIFVCPELPLERSHGIALHVMSWTRTNNLEWVSTVLSVFTGAGEWTTPTCTDKAISCDVFPSNHTLQKKAVLGVLGETEVRHAWRQKVRWKFNVHGHAVSDFLFEDQVLNGAERWVGNKSLRCG
jgi:hypothetical protein